MALSIEIGSVWKRKIALLVILFKLYEKFIQFFLTIVVPPDKIDEVWYTLPQFGIGAMCFIINRRNEPGYAICTQSGF